jgi:signal transduction histidine kinase
MSDTIKKYADLIKRVAHDEQGAFEEMLNFPENLDNDPIIAELAENINLIFMREDVYEQQLNISNEIKGHLEELNKLKTRYLGIAAHDLRSPLASIYSIGDFLSNYDLSEEKTKKLYKSICMISDQALTLVNNLLDTVAIEQGSFNLNLDTLNLSSLMDERIEMVKMMATSRGITLHSDLDIVPDTAIDEMRMRQVIDNLISNAIKFSSYGDNIYLRCKEIDNYISLIIEDQGTGIPANQLAGLFDEFKIGTNKAARGDTKTGLGLSIVKNIVDAHHGRIKVESIEDKGTTFTVSILAKA